MWEDRYYSLSDYVYEQREFGRRRKLKRSMAREAQGMEASAHKAEKALERSKQALERGDVKEANRLLEESNRHNRSSLGSAKRVTELGDKVGSKTVSEKFIQFGPNKVGTPTGPAGYYHRFGNTKEVNYGQGHLKGKGPNAINTVRVTTHKVGDNIITDKFVSRSNIKKPKMYIRAAKAALGSTTLGLGGYGVKKYMNKRAKEARLMKLKKAGLLATGVGSVLGGGYMISHKNN